MVEANEFKIGKKLAFGKVNYKNHIEIQNRRELGQGSSTKFGVPFYISETAETSDFKISRRRVFGRAPQNNIEIQK